MSKKYCVVCLSTDTGRPMDSFALTNQDLRRTKKGAMTLAMYRNESVKKRTSEAKTDPLIQYCWDYTHNWETVLNEKGDVVPAWSNWHNTGGRVEEIVTHVNRLSSNLVVMDANQQVLTKRIETVEYGAEKLAVTMASGSRELQAIHALGAVIKSMGARIDKLEDELDDAHIARRAC